MVGNGTQMLKNVAPHFFHLLLACIFQMIKMLCCTKISRINIQNTIVLKIFIIHRITRLTSATSLTRAANLTVNKLEQKYFKVNPLIPIFKILLKLKTVISLYDNYLKPMSAKFGNIGQVVNFPSAIISP